MHDHSNCALFKHAMQAIDSMLFKLQSKAHLSCEWAASSTMNRSQSRKPQQVKWKGGGKKTKQTRTLSYFDIDVWRYCVWYWEKEPHFMAKTGKFLSGRSQLQSYGHLLLFILNLPTRFSFALARGTECSISDAYHQDVRSPKWNIICSNYVPSSTRAENEDTAAACWNQ